MKRWFVGVLSVMGLVVLSSHGLAAPGEWERKAPAPVPPGRCAFPSVVMDGKIYSIGGEGAWQNLGIYDPAADSWTSGEALLPPGHEYHGAAVLDGRIYVVGGGVIIGAGTFDVFDPRARKWRQAKKPPLPLVDVYATAIGGKIFAVGKDLTAGELMIRVMVYDPTSDSWTLRKSELKRGAQFAAATASGRIYLFGGGDLHGANFARESFATVSEYDPATDTWRARADMPKKMYWQSAAAWNGKIYVSGEFPNGELWVYDVRANQWEAGPPMNTRRYLASSVAFEGKIYVIGGWINPGWGEEVEAYDTGIPSENLAVSPQGKLAAIWGRVKANER